MVAELRIVIQQMLPMVGRWFDSPAGPADVEIVDYH